jgi:hypothetical protein
MARNSDDRNKIIHILSENPSIGYACKKVGIARATHYRWMKDNPDYKVQINRALREGRLQWVDNAEAVLMKQVQNGNMRAVTFFLTHNDPRYIPKRTLYVESLDAKERREYEQALRSGVKPLPREIRDQILQAMRNYGIIKDPKKKK